MAEEQEQTTAARSETTASHPVHCPMGPKDPQLPEKPCPDYSKIPEPVRETIDSAHDKAVRAAKQACEKEKKAAEDARAIAEAAHTVAQQEYNSAKEMLMLEIADNKLEALANYEQCLRDSIPKNCDSTDDVPEDKKAVCYEQLLQNLAKEDLAFQQRMSGIDQKQSDAASAWKKAKKIYSASVCVANATMKEAKRAAETARAAELSKALESTCK